MFDHRQLAAALESVSSVPAEPIASEAAGGAPARRGVAINRAADPLRFIFDALIETVARRGYDRTTIERVLSVAEVPAPVFDEHFENKQDCFLQALDELVRRFERRLLEQPSRPAAWPERIQLGLQILLTMLAEHPDGARVAIVECLSAGEASVARLHSALARFVPVLEEGRAYASDLSSATSLGSSPAGLSSSAVEHLPSQTSTAVIGGIASIVHRRVLEGHTAELPTLLPDLLYFALMPYLGHHRATIAAGLGAGGVKVGVDV
jgi:AcrR family transcriptional regulator